MTSLRRRNTLIGVGTLIFGASGFIASGAFELGSQGSTGNEWVRVAGVDSPVLSADRGSNDGDNESSESDEHDSHSDSDDSSDDVEDTEETTVSDDDPVQELTDEPEEDEPGSEGGNGGVGPGIAPFEPVESRVQVVADPTNGGTLVSQLEWDGQMTGSNLVTTDGDGFLAGFSLENVNSNAVSRIGTIGRSGGTRGQPAFLVANIGNPATPGSGGHMVELSVTATDEDGTAVDLDEHLRLPFRVADGDEQLLRGPDLHSEIIELPVGAVAEVVIEVDTRGETAVFERLANLEFRAQAVN